MGVNVAILGHGDTLHVGITVCREAVPDVQQVADWMAEEVDVLLDLGP